MSANFAFYIHHHGSGHFMRALAIASQLKDARVTFLGSDLKRFADIIPEDFECIHLPGDVAGPEDTFSSLLRLGFLHYVPINIEKVARRTAVISASLLKLFPVILVVDVSVEVTILATLGGTPTVVMRQNGDRDDDPHLRAYECAQLLIAPSPERLIDSSCHEWVTKKTFFSGGFSKYSGHAKFSKEKDYREIGVIVGTGGTSLDGRIISALAAQCPDRTISVIGKIADSELISAPNVLLHGQIQNPASVIYQCGVVVGNAGHNTVMEMADLEKKFICIPEDRPFQEQLRKAELLRQNGFAIVVQAENLENLDWKKTIESAENLPSDCWKGVISKSALSDIALQLHKVWQNNFPEHLL
ncbi:Predicted glycosyl transferase [Dyadobacter koreensis]|uniref:Predicted glycosyl transferase n=1 Tax=Dyadobacter koreensis TaxID=408657 RepID=A0A1H6XGV0_9BACT|nr:glycosyltransferase [Dyadobacter koreensis]SEJ26754.1 Predicted glycosyl transferase [Dyadobacter koreensis]